MDAGLKSNPARFNACTDAHMNARTTQHTEHLHVAADSVKQQLDKNLLIKLLRWVQKRVTCQNHAGIR
jgi:hypothetical protein